jgi:hypothetical protein
MGKKKRGKENKCNILFHPFPPPVLSMSQNCKKKKTARYKFRTTEYSKQEK